MFTASDCGLLCLNSFLSINPLLITFLRRSLWSPFPVSLFEIPSRHSPPLRQHNLRSPFSFGKAQRFGVLPLPQKACQAFRGPLISAARYGSVYTCLSLWERWHEVTERGNCTLRIAHFLTTPPLGPSSNTHSRSNPACKGCTFLKAQCSFCSPLSF